MTPNQPAALWQQMTAALPPALSQSLELGLGDGWAKALQQLRNLDLGGMGLMPQGGDPPQVGFAPGKLLQIQQDYVREASELWNQTLQANFSLKDKRFKGDAWARNPLASFSAAVYLLNARTLMALAEAAEGDAKTKARLRFAVEQWMAAAAPSNFLAFNPEAQRKAIETKGESLAKGVQNMLHDMRQGHVSMTEMRRENRGNV